MLFLSHVAVVESEYFSTRRPHAGCYLHLEEYDRRNGFNYADAGLLISMGSFVEQAGARSVPPMQVPLIPLAPFQTCKLALRTTASDLHIHHMLHNDGRRSVIMRYAC